MSLLNDTIIRQLSVDAEFYGADLLGGLDKLPLLCPFSEQVNEGVISYGLSHAGYDLRLGNELLVFKNSYNEIIDPKRFKDEEYSRRVFDTVKPGKYMPSGDCFKPYSNYVNNGYVIPPHSYALGFSVEYIRMPKWLKGRCVGKSTLARCGILINTTPIEPGWHGHLTIEISNITPCSAIIYAQEGIAQMEFERMVAEPSQDYGAKSGKYQSQGATPVPARVKEHDHHDSREN